MPTFVGRLRIIKNFLGSEPFAVLARLNYMVYMIHILVLLFYIGNEKSAVYVNTLNQWFISIGATVFSFIFAIPFTLLCEVPFMNLEKNFLFPAPQRVKGAQAEIAPLSKPLVSSKKYKLLEEGDTLETQS
jgi:peptidoglycan/LPS O-acetylase OafA/YrhL